MNAFPVKNREVGHLFVHRNTFLFPISDDVSPSCDICQILPPKARPKSTSPEGDVVQNSVLKKQLEIHFGKKEINGLEMDGETDQ